MSEPTETPYAENDMYGVEKDGVSHLLLPDYTGVLV